MGVNITADAHRDARFEVLGRDLGFHRCRHEVGLGTMVCVWDLAKKLGTNVLTQDELAPLVPPSSLVRSRLAEKVPGGFRLKGMKATGSKEATAEKDNITHIAEQVIGWFNEGFGRRFQSKGYRAGVKRVLAAGYNLDEMRAAMMVAIDRWGDTKYAGKMNPNIVLRLSAPAGKSVTFHTLFSEAGEMWAEKNPGEPVPWRKK